MRGREAFDGEREFTFKSHRTFETLILNFFRCDLNVHRDIARDSSENYLDLGTRKSIEKSFARVERMRKMCHDFSHELSVIHNDFSRGKSSLFLTKEEKELFEITRGLVETNLRLNMERLKMENHCLRCKHIIEIINKMSFVRSLSFRGHSSRIIRELCSGSKTHPRRIEYAQNLLQIFNMVLRCVSDLRKEAAALEHEVAHFGYPMQMSLPVLLIQRALSGWRQCMVSMRNLLRIAMIGASIRIDGPSRVDSLSMANDWDIASLIDRVHEISKLFEDPHVCFKELRFAMGETERLRATYRRAAAFDRNREILQMLDDFVHTSYRVHAKFQTKDARAIKSIKKVKNIFDKCLASANSIFQQRRSGVEEDDDIGEKKKPSVPRLSSLPPTLPPRPTIHSQDLCRTDVCLSVPAIQNAHNYFSLFREVISKALERALVEGTLQNKRNRGSYVVHKLRRFLRKKNMARYAKRGGVVDAGQVKRAKREEKKMVSKIIDSFADKLTLLYCSFDDAGNVQRSFRSVSDCLNAVPNFPVESESLTKYFVEVGENVISSVTFSHLNLRKGVFGRITTQLATAENSVEK